MRAKPYRVVVDDVMLVMDPWFSETDKDETLRFAFYNDEFKSQWV